MADFEDAIHTAKALRFVRGNGVVQDGTVTHMWDANGGKWRVVRGTSYYQYHYQQHHIDPDGSIGYSNRWVRERGVQDGPRPYSTLDPPSAAGAETVATLYPDITGRTVVIAGWYGSDDFKLLIDVEVTNDSAGKNGIGTFMASRGAGEANYNGAPDESRTLRFRYKWQNELDVTGTPSNWSNEITFI